MTSQVQYKLRSHHKGRLTYPDLSRAQLTLSQDVFVQVQMWQGNQVPNSRPMIITDVDVRRIVY